MVMIIVDKIGPSVEHEAELGRILAKAGYHVCLPLRVCEGTQCSLLESGN